MSDAILFNNIPGSGLTAPIFSFEVNSGGQYSQVDRFIIVGHATAAGSIKPGQLVPVSDQNTVDQLTGGGSMLREMFRLAAKNAPAAPFWLMAVAEVGVAAQWTLVVNALSSTGVATLMLAGEAITVAVGATDTPASIAAALAAAVNGYYDQLSKTMLHVTATVSGATVTFKSRHAGIIFNETDFFCPSLAGSNLFALPGAVTIARTVDGAGVPVVGSALAPLADDPADYVVCPWTDPLSLQAYTSFSGDVSGRWAWNRQSYGHVWTAASGTFAGLVTLGLGLNDRHLTIIGRAHSPFASYALNLPGVPTAGQAITIAGTVVTFGTAVRPGADRRRRAVDARQPRAVPVGFDRPGAQEVHLRGRHVVADPHGRDLRHARQLPRHRLDGRRRHAGADDRVERQPARRLAVGRRIRGAPGAVALRLRHRQRVAQPDGPRGAGHRAAARPHRVAELQCPQRAEQFRHLHLERRRGRHAAHRQGGDHLPDRHGRPARHRVPRHPGHVPDLGLR